MDFSITISSSFLLSTSYYSTLSLLQDLRTPRVLIISTSSPETQPLKLEPTSTMSRHSRDRQAYYGDRHLPDPRMLNSRTVPTHPYYGNRYVPESQIPSRRTSTDPTGYISSTVNSDGWRGQRTFEELVPYKGDDRPDYLDSPTLPPMRSLYSAQGSPGPRTSLGDSNSGRSVQNTRHFSRPEERVSERHISTAHGYRITRNSEGRGSGNPGEGGKNPVRKKDSEIYTLTQAFAKEHLAQMHFTKVHSIHSNHPQNTNPTQNKNQKT